MNRRNLITPLAAVLAAALSLPTLLATSSTATTIVGQPPPPPPPPPLPNLVVGTVVLPLLTPGYVRIEVKNTGNATAVASVTGLAISSSCWAQQVLHLGTGSIPAGKSAIVSIWIPACTSKTGFTYCASADDYKNVAESNEFDNSRCNYQVP